MATRTTYQTVCDRCEQDIGEVNDDATEDTTSILLIEAPTLGFSLKEMKDLCEPCMKELPGLLQKVVSVTRKKPKKGKEKQ
ncbi:hypothetical protein LCGC14_2037980 [marine sediment metagenome]|uniref:Uncharacterized protein n=1 Tax=marine sediment metagenome TaxID=412755 RepID=A0A0F9HPT2_9ZZZZ